MKNSILICALSALVMSVAAENPDRPPHTSGGGRPEWGKGDRKRLDRHNEMSPEEKAKMQERKLQLMEKSLQEIGVTDEQRLQILELQKIHREKIRANMLRMEKARKKLSDLQENSAPTAERHAAIREIADAQGDQLIIFDDNRTQMEAILGQEKFKEFMDKARAMYREHGRRGGSGIPPRPNFPPTPKDKQPGDDTPPVPETTANGNIPPIPTT